MSIISMIDDIVSQLVDLQHDLEKLAESDKGEL